jgi:hypothetical protein
MWLSGLGLTLRLGNDEERGVIGRNALNYRPHQVWGSAKHGQRHGVLTFALLIAC